MELIKRIVTKVKRLFNTKVLFNTKAKEIPKGSIVTVPVKVGVEDIPQEEDFSTFDPFKAKEEFRLKVQERLERFEREFTPSGNKLVPFGYNIVIELRDGLRPLPNI